MKTLYLLTAAILVFVSCNQKNTSDATELEVQPPNQETVKKRRIKMSYDRAKKVIYSLPSPHEVAQLLIDENSLPFDKGALNPVAKVSSYTTSKDQAVNLGIYCTDLSYSSLYNQNQEVMNYMSVSKKLAEDLGIINIIGEETLRKLEDNINNRDEIFSILAELLMDTDFYLQENKREELMILVQIGGWLEGLYLATSISGEDLDEFPELKKKILEQNIAIASMKELLRLYQHNPAIQQMQKDIQQIEYLYDNILYSANKAEKQKNYNAFTEEISKIRNRYTL